MHAVRITIICDECVRIEYAPEGKFCDYPSLFAIHGPTGDAAWTPGPGGTERAVFTTSASAGSPPIEVRTRRVTLRYTPDGRPPHAGNMRAEIEHPAPPVDVASLAGRVVWTPGLGNRHNLGGTLSTLDGLRGAHPLGEGLLARDGWHVVDDSRRHVLIDGWAATREAAGVGNNLDWYLFAYGDDYAAALRALATVAGRVPLPRRYALGSWYSRYWPYTSDEFRGIVDEFDVHGFPLDVLVLDMDWHREGWTGWSWNRTLLPDAEDLIAWLHERQIAVTLNLHPADGVGPHEDRYADFMRALGREPDGSTVLFDAGDRAYMRALFERVHRPLEMAGPDKETRGRGDGENGAGPSGGRPVSAFPDPKPTSGDPHPTSRGVDFWWVDWQQDKFVRSIPELTNLRWLNHLYFQHTRREAGGSEPGLRGLSFSRWAADEGDEAAGTEWGSPATGGWGDHRHPIHFSGDAHTGWDMLAFQVPFTATAGNIGCFYWSHDIGGHFGPRLEETTTRWVQFGALSAALRLHSARAASLDRRPWTYREPFQEAMRRAFELRAMLVPYIYTCARECCDATMPLLRPMYLHWPREERAYHVPGQYMLGADVLVAPITTPGMGERCVATRHVWFPAAPPGAPAGAGGWCNLLTGERHEPDEDSIVAAPIDQVPLFVRAGALLPCQPVARRMTREPLSVLVLRVFPGVPGQTAVSALYEDDGETLDHERGRFSRTYLSARWTRGVMDTLVLEALVGTTAGEYLGQPGQRGIELRLGGVHRPVSGSIDGHETEVEFRPDEVGGLCVVRVPARDIRSATNLRVEFVPTDPRLIAHRARLANLSAAIGAGVGTTHLRDAVVAHCRAADATHRLAIGAGIGMALENGSLRVIDSLGWIDGARAEVEIVERLGHVEAVASKEMVRMEATAGHARSAAAPLPPTTPAAPPVGLRASRVARLRFTLHGTPMIAEHEISSRLTPLSSFLVAGPFDWDWRRFVGDQRHGPESTPGALDPSAAFVGRGGERLGWRPTVAGSRWPVDLRASLGTRGGLAYLATMLVARKARHATLHFECGDKLQAWLNGTPIITLDDYSEHGSREPHARVELREGANLLLVKVTDGGGGWGVSIGVESDEPIGHGPPTSAGGPS